MKISILVESGFEGYQGIKEVETLNKIEQLKKQVYHTYWNH